MDPRLREIVRAMFKMAWIDGQMAPQELTTLCRLMERIGVPLADRLVLADGFLHDPDLEEVRLEDVLHDQASRLLAVQLLITVCFSDEDLAPEEMQYLHETATRLGINAQQLDELRAVALSTLGAR